jgi:hypothetical protein
VLPRLPARQIRLTSKWEIAARDVEPQAVPTAEQPGDREQLDGDPRPRPAPSALAAPSCRDSAPAVSPGQVHREALRKSALGG